MPDRPRLVALISGGGTTLQNLIDRAAAGRLGVELVGVVSSKAGAFGVERARRAGVPFAIVERGRGGNGGGDKETRSGSLSPSFPERVWSAVRTFNADLVALAGWLHLLPIPADFRHKVLNIHPSLLPAFGGKGMYGRHVHEAVLEYGAKVSGCTVHFADDTYDTGPIVIQRSVPVVEGDTPDALAARVFEAECEAYPEAIELVAAGRVRVEGRRVVIAPRG
ncbi:phosphoribosylglycinamide formyltransferase : Phosphoribosylglycinamide formyltransferase OS=Planctomyces limnophilus (strain ATCC 43296 / DSM 3776 / IFAM 1008 / 290) GN=Plim_1759 PE=4 SV=1: Formyl_trans_N [Gemmataceae bacterium]|nr:phosphoribosylglycinamide formyltransferase : Phosphoribosylglycinamide formyltransferase OS=Planctomyces limnophilus (strain ATCC 43296 / DSM 3776 / IFAM 1008 / 290) GN=Plim_1759 PE=4 SV=1: Formyl_trans_N [Gemmataceae bacterium]VTT99271.1 phosphoribosylglycinamide formyltransferase : Phosphoribosylglycinamide formyltransferase OS=Planctomyces limnophilus (strain ATCC 43296 / DSM 3776 / IFAM 1008 / 290) GN=Plim_1759 PE=4 SV=1: Formyl_trans_N [Gemmataceae bacterium]